MAQIQNAPRELGSRRVLARFVIRTTILVAFAALGSIDFGKSLAALLAMSAILCAVLAVVRREAAFPPAINHWDEALAYAALYFLTVALGLSSPL
ncbi:MAG TPA: hypothetical protein VNY08_07450 [Bradyrhizobium sp.]|nr:hypothetical protein [Bradyrhizobium sp.]